MSGFDRFSQATNICPDCRQEIGMDCRCWEYEQERRDNWEFTINHRRRFSRDAVRDAIADLRRSRREWA